MNRCSSVVLYGASGVGKTSIVQAFAKKFNLSVVRIQPSWLKNKVDYFFEMA